MSGVADTTFELETERLQLRLLEAGDETLFCGLYTDPETMRFIAPPLSAAQAISSFRKIVVRQYEPSLEGRFLAVLERATRQPVGICGTSQHDVDALRLEVGILLRLEARGRGLAHEALMALMKRIFAMSPIQEICVRFSAECPAVERLNIRIGFTPCADEVPGEGLMSKRVWSVHRSPWYADQTVN
nr:GNAT family N-acetyltransferase [Rhodanobacter sp. MP1X3]